MVWGFPRCTLLSVPFRSIAKTLQSDSTAYLFSGHAGAIHDDGQFAKTLSDSLISNAVGVFSIQEIPLFSLICKHLALFLQI